jgi:arginine-tRNA-protein transferase
VDVLGDGLSLVYSFFDPAHQKRSLGSFVILDHVVQAGLTDMPYVYLGYWIAGSLKMAYKAKFNPLEVLKPGGWVLLSARDRDAG